MKRYILFGLLAATLVVVQANGQVAQQFTNAHTLYLTVLDCADPGDESMKLSLAGRWDLLPAGLPGSVAAIYKEKAAEAFEKKYLVRPEQVDLTKLTQYGNLRQVCDKRAKQHGQQRNDMEAAIEQFKSANVAQEARKTKETTDLRDMKVALMRFSRAIRDLGEVAAGIGSKLTGSSISPRPGEPIPPISAEVQEQLSEDAENLETAYNTYQQALARVRAKGKQIGVDLDLQDELIDQALGSMVKRANEAATATPAVEETATPEVTVPTGAELPEGLEGETGAIL